MEGDFSFLRPLEAGLFKNAYDAITDENLWDFFKTYEPPNGFMFSDAPELRRLDARLEPMGHSGASYGLSLRAMQYIAKRGWGEFVRAYTPVAEVHTQ